ncbi:DEAD/DEAH box helicase [Nakamurella leprariae]|uniref:DEAD/DEAH box helicase n=1 Tax=Nakamurella leprariae TaxID=2803911 RepID=UPI001F3D8CF9|nr:DEAD/DEAH box helicase [Nakamurella leprariae]
MTTVADLVPAGENPQAWRERLGGPDHSGLVDGEPDPDTVYDAFTGWAQQRGLSLYSHQEEALLEIVAENNVIVATPTGSGKSMIATAALFAGLTAQQAGGSRRAYYTAPIKALVSEKFFDLVDIFGADAVGMITGDSAVNATAPIICCTAEILAGIALRGGADADPGVVVMDEFHYYGDPQRGWAWQVPLLELPRAQFVLMSATLGDVSFFAEDLTARTGRETSLITGVQRPVPLHFEYTLVPLTETLQELISTGRAPVYLVHFTQAAALERAQALSSLAVATRAERDQIAETIGDFRFSAGFGRTLSRLVRQGIGVHHAGMLPKYRRLVEKLAQSGLLKVICGTDTLGVGINVPIRTVLLTGLSKYDGRRTRLLSVREFHQIAGRTGRAGYDTAGDVVVLAPEHVIENERALAKAGDDPAKKRKVVRRKPPEGFVNWTEKTFDKLVEGGPESLRSHFRVSHAMVLGVIARPGDAFTAMRRLIEGSHEPRDRQLRHALRAIAVTKALLTAGIIERLDVPDATGRRYRLTEDLQLDFALDQPLSPLALAALEMLDRESDGYPLDVVSLIEATLEGPGTILAAQRYKARGDAVAAMKADGLEYEERMELLEEVEHPKPLADLIEVAYETYRRGHPWVAEYTPDPKSIVRDMFERAMTFSEYVAFYGLSRSEGVVLRYFADAYRAMRRTVPLDARTEELTDIVSWLGELVRGVDSSLLDEWEALAHPDEEETGLPGVRPPSADAGRGVTANVRGFTVMVRNALFRRVELLSRRAYADLGELRDLAPEDAVGASVWTEQAWAEAMDGYWAEYDDLAVGADARSAALITVRPGPQAWSVRQVFDDPQGDRDWGITAEIDVAAADEAGEPVLRVLEVGPFG